VTERRFFDTNILVYAHASDDKQKRKMAQELVGAHLRSKTAVISTQVLQEFFKTTTRIGVSADTSRRHVADWAQTNVVQVTKELILAAIDLHRLHQISFWDALILRAARDGGCSVVFSEELNDGQIFDGVRVENPFAAR
jgi:predicted nucleic acid-binding protein